MRSINNTRVKNSMLLSHPLGQEANDKSMAFLLASMIILLLVFGSRILTAQNVIETNKKATNDIYLNSWAQGKEINELQRQTLFAIAMLTPYVGGKGVYSARAMLGIEPEDYNLPYRKSKPGDTSATTDDDFKIKVYPNPTSGIISFEPECKTKYFIEIFDSYGKLIGNYSSDNLTTTVDLSKLNSGIYIYKVYTESGFVKSGKFIKL